ncbi:hypothetical protein BGZ90_009460 [Linnemannia elongata]|nr:hypothetical protein BGZ90_009460 [Linnemannia elongata]
MIKLDDRSTLDMISRLLTRSVDFGHDRLTSIRNTPNNLILTPDLRHNLIVGWYTDEISVYPEERRTSAVIYSTHRMPFRVPKVQVYVHLLFRKAQSSE